MGQVSKKDCALYLNYQVECFSPLLHKSISPEALILSLERSEDLPAEDLEGSKQTLLAD